MKRVDEDQIKALKDHICWDVAHAPTEESIEVAIRWFVDGPDPQPKMSLTDEGIMASWVIGTTEASIVIGDESAQWHAVDWRSGQEDSASLDLRDDGPAALVSALADPLAELCQW